MHILFLTHYFPPEVNAPATRTYEHCARWVREGHEVTVVTCVPNCPDGVVFDGYRSRWRPQVEMVDGVRVVRVWTYLAPNAGTGRRILNYLSYMVSAIFVALFALRRPDVVVATSPQFFCGWAGVWASWLRRVPFVLEIRDIWPESIEAVGALKKGLLIRSLEWLERRMYASADHIVTVGNGYRERILEKTTGPERVSVVTNGVDLDRFVVGPPSGFRERWNLGGRFVCSYVGTIGMAHGLEVVLEAAEMLRDAGRTDDVRFLLVGDGARREWLQQEAARRGVDDVVVFTGRLPKEAMPDVLANSDACLIHLRGCELFGSVIPSKVFETMAMQRPIIMGVRGEAQEIVLRAGAGLPMEPDSASSLVSCVERLMDEPALAADLGRSARDFVAAHYSRDVLAQRCLDVLLQVGQPTPATAS